MKKKKGMLRILIITPVLIVTMTSCEKTEISTSVELEDPTNYVGIWKNDNGYDRSYVLYGDESYELYSIIIGAEPALLEVGIFQCRNDIINLDENGNTEDEFAISNQLTVMSDSTLMDDYGSYIKLTDDPEYGVLEGLTDINYSIDDYIGEWYNETVKVYMIIKSDNYLIMHSDGTINGKPDLENEYIVINDEAAKLTEAGIEIEGYEGVFSKAAEGTLEKVCGYTIADNDDTLFDLSAWYGTFSSENGTISCGVSNLDNYVSVSFFLNDEIGSCQIGGLFADNEIQLSDSYYIYTLDGDMLTVELQPDCEDSSMKSFVGVYQREEVSPSVQDDISYD
ncbi:MAG: hypothetical protein ACERKZ_21575 [Lachnotalea sp.]